MSILVWCLIIKNNRTIHSGPFSTPCTPGLRIDRLKTQIVRTKRAARQIYGTIHPDDLDVYYNSAVRTALEPSELQASIRDLDLDEALVKPCMVATEVAYEDGLLIFKMPPSPTTSYCKSSESRSPSPDIDHFPRLEHAKILQETPSQVAEFSKYKALQDDSKERLLDDRPNPDLNIAPIALLYAPFGEFDDIFSGRVPPAEIDCDFARVEQQVDELAAAMSLSYPTDDERQLAGLSVLQGMFAFSLGQEGSTAYGLVTAIATFKNLLCSVPYVESVARIARSHISSDKVEDMCERWRIPALCIAMDGSKIEFHAVLLLGHQYRVVRLTPSLSWSPFATNGRDRKQLYSAFAAAYVLQQRIHRDLDSYMRPSEPLPPVLVDQQIFLPAMSKIPERGRDAADQKYIEFKIFDHFGPREHNLTMYAARVSNIALTNQHEYIILKFSKRYSIELHEFCAERGHAPKIYGYERLPGGWVVVAMEHLTGEVMQSHHYSSEKEKSLLELVEGFHAKDLVHGDLRFGNILCDKSSDNFWLVDFDWGGKASEVEYPTWCITDELSEGRQSKDSLIISKEDDLRILRATLEKLKSK